MINKNQKDWIYSKQLLQEIRDKFLHIDSDPYTGKRIFFENAGGSFTLKSVIEAMIIATELPDCPSRPTAAAKKNTELVDKGLEDIKLFLGAKTGKIITEETGTKVLFDIAGTIIENIPGTNVVTTKLEHPANYNAAAYYASKHSKELRVADVNPSTGGVDVEAILEKIDRNTCLLSFMYASNITGAILDAETIVKEARKINPDLYILIDSIQHVAHTPVDIEKLQIDGFGCVPYKIFGKKGFGIGYISDRVAKLPHKRILFKNQDDWSLGSIDPADYSGWTAITDYICWLGKQFIDSNDRRDQIIAGMKSIEFNEGYLLNRALDGTKKINGLRHMDGVIVHFLQKNSQNHSLLLPISIKRKSAREAVMDYLKNGIVVYDRTATSLFSKRTLDALGIPSLIRVSPIHCNSPEEIDKFLSVTSKIS